jgi:ATP-dependent helicase HrpA
LPEWIESVGSHLIKKSYSEPKWDKHTGRVIAMEKGTMQGLEIYAKRRVHFGEVNPKEAREIFVHHALVHGEIEKPPPQLRANIELETKVKQLEERCRRSHLLCDYDKRFRYYDSRVPAEIVTAGQFEKWRYEASKTNPRVLCMAIEDLVADGVQLPDPDAFPDVLDLGPLKLPLTYVHDTGDEADGVTMRVPIDALGQVPQERLAWLVPGHVQEKIDLILRGLPKDYRRLLPAPAQLAPQLAELMLPTKNTNNAAQTKHALHASRENFYDTLRLAILTATQQDVPKDALLAAPTPAWMTLRLEVVDEQGKTIAAGRDANKLRSLLSGRIRDGLVASAKAQTRKGIKHWDFGDLPERIELERGGMKFGAFPGIVDDKDSVSVQLFDTFDAAQAATRFGSRRLFMLSAADALRRHATNIPGLEQAALHYASLGNASALRTHVQELIADRAFIGDMLPVRTEKEFAFRVSRGLEKLPAAVAEVAPVVGAILLHAHDVRRELSLRHPAPFEVAVNDMRDQLIALVPPNFAAAHPFEWLRHVPRYLQGMRIRLQRLPGGGVARDAKLMEEVSPLVKGLSELQLRQQSLGLSPVKIQELRWHIEEFRIQLFAQELRTAFPVSSKRLQEMWNAIVKG